MSMKKKDSSTEDISDESTYIHVLTVTYHYGSHSYNVTLSFLVQSYITIRFLMVTGFQWLDFTYRQMSRSKF